MYMYVYVYVCVYWNYPMPHASTIRRRSKQSQAIGSTALL